MCLVLDKITHIMAEHGGDGLQAHAPVDGLGGQGVAQLVGVEVAEPGPAGHPVEHAGDHVAVQRPALHAEQEALAGMGRPPGVEQGQQHRVQRDVAVVAQLAHRHLQPPALPDAHHRVGLQGADLAHPHPGAGQQLEH